MYELEDINDKRVVVRSYLEKVDIWRRILLRVKL